MDKEYEVIVIGAGPAGSTAARVAARDQRKIALIERDRLGGTCLNYGCDPTKALLDATHASHAARAIDLAGLDLAIPRLSWPKALARARDIVDEIRAGDEEAAIRRQEKRGIDVFTGDARFDSGHRLTVDGERLSAPRIIIATGAKPRIPPIDGLENCGYLTSRTLLTEVEELPERIAIIGAGPVSIEFCQMLTRFGSKVVVIEQLPHILGADDHELANRLRELLACEGIDFILEAKVTAVTRTAAKTLHLEFVDGKSRSIEVDEILLATGRIPCTDTLDLETAGVAVDPNGWIIVDDCLRTSVEGIFSAGDVASPELPFTHVAGPQGKLAMQNAFSDTPGSFNRHAIPHATYTDPTLAAVGKTEEALREEGVDYCKGVSLFRDLARGKTSGKREGCVKILADREGHILGGHILAEHAGDLIAPIVLAMRENLRVECVAEAIYPYPTFVEAVRGAAAQVCPPP